MSETTVDCVIIGAGPAGLSAALNLARARRRVLVVDSNRPRNAATMVSHGFLTRDGIPPHELRKLAREELAGYPEVEIVERTAAVSVRPAVDVGAAEGGPVPRFTVTLAARSTERVVHAAAVIVATGLRETLPALPSIRAFYGMSLFSCAACDGYEQSDRPLALIGETDDLCARALLTAQWSSDLTVFTNDAPVLTEAEEDILVAADIRVERRRIDDLEGDRGAISAVRLIDGERIPVQGGFVRPLWHPMVEFLTELEPDVDDDGHLITDRSGRTSVPGLYAAGDVAAPGPQQLIVAAGHGARVAAVITHDLLGIRTAH